MVLVVVLVQGAVLGLERVAGLGLGLGKSMLHMWHWHRGSTMCRRNKPTGQSTGGGVRNQPCMTVMNRKGHVCNAERTHKMGRCMQCRYANTGLAGTTYPLWATTCKWAGGNCKWAGDNCKWAGVTTANGQMTAAMVNTFSLPHASQEVVCRLHSVQVWQNHSSPLSLFSLSLS